MEKVVYDKQIRKEGMSYKVNHDPPAPPFFGLRSSTSPARPLPPSSWWCHQIVDDIATKRRFKAEELQNFFDLKTFEMVCPETSRPR